MQFLAAVIFGVIVSVLFRVLRIYKRKVLEPIFMGIALFGIVALCQPLFYKLFQVGFAILLVGLVGFNIAIHMKQEEDK